LITRIKYSEPYNHEAPLYVVFSSLFSLPPSKPPVSPSVPVPQTPSAYVLSYCDRPNSTSIQNNRQNYSYAYFSAYILRLQVCKYLNIVSKFS
jgi:hypothetical protein